MSKHEEVARELRSCWVIILRKRVSDGTNDTSI